MKFKAGDSVVKRIGNYSVTGKVVSAWVSEDDKLPRYVVRFNYPPGLLHLYPEHVLEPFTAELLPCPFCGCGESHAAQSISALTIHIECNSCGAAGPESESLVEAKEAWNRRV